MIFELIRQAGFAQFLAREAVPLGLSLILAELFFKFGSFTLEALAFLGTWFVLSAVVSAILGSRAD